MPLTLTDLLDQIKTNIVSGNLKGISGQVKSDNLLRMQYWRCSNHFQAPLAVPKLLGFKSTTEEKVIERGQVQMPQLYCSYQDSAGILIKQTLIFEDLWLVSSSENVNFDNFLLLLHLWKREYFEFLTPQFMLIFTTI